MVATQNIIEKMRKDGYPYKIKGIGGNEATLYDIQPLWDDVYMAIYSYPDGKYYHNLQEIKCRFEVIEQ